MRVPSPPTPPFGGGRFCTPSFGILSTYPPTACGMATFSTALADGLIANGAEVSIVRVADGSTALQQAGHRRASEWLPPVRGGELGTAQPVRRGDRAS